MHSDRGSSKRIRLVNGDDDHARDDEATIFTRRRLNMPIAEESYDMLAVSLDRSADAICQSLGIENMFHYRDFPSESTESRREYQHELVWRAVTAVQSLTSILLEMKDDSNHSPILPLFVEDDIDIDSPQLPSQLDGNETEDFTTDSDSSDKDDDDTVYIDL